MTPLSALARDYGIQTSYYDSEHRRQTVSRESIIGVLRALGAIEEESDAGDALRERRLSLWRRPIEPVFVAWDGLLEAIEVRSPASGDATLGWTIEMESGDTIEGSAQIADLAVTRRETLDGEEFAARRLTIDRRLPPGYHTLTAEVGGVSWRALVISAPVQAYDRLKESRRRVWGIFAPLYALRSPDYWGAGDFGDLERLAEWVAGKGGTAVMTLPLLASFLDEPFNPSPYSPVSRLFWNEMYIDVERAPELEHCPSARQTIASPDFQESLHSLRRTDLVDYRGVMALKRGILEQLAICLFEWRSERREQMGAWADNHPGVYDYARFRAATERTNSIWMNWPQRMRDGRIDSGDYDPASARYHVYAQWLADSQVRSAGEKAARGGVSLYFDMPIGVDRAGYDVWRYRNSFVDGVNAGAPPDSFFTKGQDWGFPPMSPEGERASGYRYFRASIEQLLQVAGMLRIDHVMGLHRLYWVPRGMSAAQGAYVRYPADELYAVLCLESHRHRAAIMGEDLGTVPNFVRRAMSRHNLMRSYVLQFELPGEAPVRRPPKKSVASLNTHDMPPFAAFWTGTDIEDRLALGHIDEESAARQRSERGASRKQLTAVLAGFGKLEGKDEAAPAGASVQWLLNSQAGAVLVNVEDLWLETQPQNIPGTTGEHSNWRRKLRYGLDEFSTLPGVNAALGCAENARRVEATK